MELYTRAKKKCIGVYENKRIKVCGYVLKFTKVNEKYLEVFGNTLDL